MIEVHGVRQFDEPHCVAACLEGILEDLGHGKSQKLIVEEHPVYFTSPELGRWTVTSERWLDEFAGLLRALGLLEAGGAIATVHDLPANRRTLENLRLSGYQILIFYNPSPRIAARFAGLYDDRSFLADPQSGMRAENDSEFANREALAVCFRPTLSAPEC